MLQSCVCWRQQTTATRWRQLPAGLFGRVHMHLEANLGRDAGALDQLAEASDFGAPLSETKVKAALVPAAPAIHPRAFGKLHPVTVCRELSDADQIIKFENGGTDRRLKNRTTGPFLRFHAYGPT